MSGIIGCVGSIFLDRVCVAGLVGVGVMDFAHCLNESSLGFGT